MSFKTTNRTVKNTNGTVGNRLMSYYKWSYMTNGCVAQGGNSVFEDQDGKVYVVFHERNTGSSPEAHHIAVHQLFTIENG